MNNEGWTCPVCRRGVAPGEKHCDHGSALRVQIPQTFPDVAERRYGPSRLYDTGNAPDCGCAPGTICCNVACPRALRVTC